jgi:hypothetical protein
VPLLPLLLRQPLLPLPRNNATQFVTSFAKPASSDAGFLLTKTDI